MAARTKYDPAFKAKTLARLSQETVAAVAKDIKVSTPTIYSWAQKAGLRLNGGKKKARVSKKAQRSNGKAHGPVTVMSMTASLATVEKELEAALVSIRASRVAMAQVFGG